MATQGELCAVTGVSGYTGRHITRRLLASGRTAINLTGHPERETEFGEAVRSAPFSFNDPDTLARSLEGVSTLFNTYWIRFTRGPLTFDVAVKNSLTLIEAAKAAGVRRIVHVSITNPSLDSPLPYFSGKAKVETAIKESGLSYAILRPTVIFGDGGILINNIAWFLRRLPVFAIPGSGEYEMQPLSVDDLADLAVRSADIPEDMLIDAVGPEVFAFRDLVRMIAEAVGSRSLIVSVPPSLALIGTWAMGLALGDVVLTRNEVDGLHANLLISSDPPTCSEKLSEWLPKNADWLGRRYFSEVGKHFR